MAGCPRNVCAHQAREELLERLTEDLEGSRMAEEYTRKACDLFSKFGYRRYLQKLKRGGLKIDRGAVRRDDWGDGKYVPITNDLNTPAEALVLGYRDMLRAERAFRSTKTGPEIEPVYHRKPVRIREHDHL